MTGQEIKKNTEETNKMMDATSKTVDTLNVVLPFLEKNFGAISYALTIAGVDTDRLTDNFHEFKAALDALRIEQTTDNINKFLVSLKALVTNGNDLTQALDALNLKLFVMKQQMGALAAVSSFLGTPLGGLVMDGVKATGVFSGLFSAILKGVGVIGVFAFAIKKTIVDFAALRTLIPSFISLLRDLGKQFTTTNLGIFGLGLQAQETATILSQLQFTLIAFNSRISQTLQIVLGVSSIFAAFVGVIVTELIVGIGKLVSWMGDKLVAASVAASDQFAKVEKQAKIFASTLTAVNTSLGSGLYLEEYISLIMNLSNAYNMSFLSLQKASQEFVLVGSQLGLNSKQIKEWIFYIS